MKTNNFLTGALLYALVVVFVACNGNNPENTDNTGGTDSGITADGACSHAFQVSSSGKKVYFSKGNLQYQASTDTWRFAENQYDYIGGENVNISSSYSGWIDLFGWGTGNNPTLASTDYKDYATFTDWGVNAISNGGNKANQWRTLTSDEWEYVFTNSLHIPATVCGVAGRLLFPSDWKCPDGLTYVTDAVSYKTNVYTLKQWEQLQRSGAVFFPASGFRYGTDVYLMGDGSNVWSATPYNELNASGLYFASVAASVNSYNRSSGQAVRLVRDVK